MDMGELAQAGNLGRPGMPPMSNRDMLKAKLQKDKFMTKPLSEIVASETEMHVLCGVNYQIRDCEVVASGAEKCSVLDVAAVLVIEGVCSQTSLATKMHGSMGCDRALPEALST
eukprot:1158921-Pelagomonas_calceolata.AAC.9